MIAGLLGGRAAEEIALGRITNGAANDLERVTQLARTMVTRWGMSNRLGLRVFGRKDEMIFLGREISEERDYSERVAELIDEEVQAIVQKQYARAYDILAQKRDKLELVAQRLLEVETLGRNDFLILIGENPEDEEPHRRDPKPEPKPKVETKPLSGEIPQLGTSPSPA
jgi:cell division protease FtsH